ncbi:MAG: stage 0 sporulation family protein [Bacilli bacterium]|nr:stage 0 sporulation family protein [Bacilli bacterium]
MKKIVGIGFKDGGKIYWFNPNFLNVKAGDKVVVETVRGLELGYVVMPIREIEDKDFEHELKDIIRIASDKDIKDYNKNEERAKEDFEKAKKIIKAQKLDMKTLGCEYTLDGSKLLIYYNAEGRVDFRELVKVLASEFKVRIELRQIGPREGAKIVGGIGACGRELCCKKHLREFDLVTMKMAKDQGMALTANKITGLCGKLMCCISYENCAYLDAKKNMPAVGDIVKTPNGDELKVTSINVLSKKVSLDNNGAVEVFDVDKLKIIKHSKQVKEEISKEEIELEKEVE